jgi:hypothetical protein
MPMDQFKKKLESGEMITGIASNDRHLRQCCIDHTMNVRCDLLHVFLAPGARSRRANPI